MKRGDEDDPTPYHKLDTDIWFKHTNKAVRTLYFNRWGINGPELGRGLCFEYDDNFMMNELPLNRCVVEVTGGRAGHQWCGNILVLRMESLRSYDFYANADMQEDLKPFVTYFEEYNKVKPVYWHHRSGESTSRDCGIAYMANYGINEESVTGDLRLLIDTYIPIYFFPKFISRVALQLQAETQIRLGRGCRAIKPTLTLRKGFLPHRVCVI